MDLKVELNPVKKTTKLISHINIWENTTANLLSYREARWGKSFECHQSASGASVSDHSTVVINWLTSGSEKQDVQSDITNINENGPVKNCESKSRAQFPTRDIFSHNTVNTHTPLRSLRSSGQNLWSVPYSRLKTKGYRALLVAAPTLWNSLALSPRTLEAVVAFKAQLKISLNLLLMCFLDFL